MQKNDFARYNDGMVFLYREKKRESSFGAKRNAVSLEHLDFIVKLAYGELSKRQQDMEFAQQQSFSLDLKIKTRVYKGVDNKCKAVINGYLYDIEFIDFAKGEMFLYLQGVGELA